MLHLSVGSIPCRFVRYLKDLHLTLWGYKTTWCDLFAIRKKMALPAI